MGKTKAAAGKPGAEQLTSGSAAPLREAEAPVKRDPRAKKGEPGYFDRRFHSPEADAKVRATYDRKMAENAAAKKAASAFPTPEDLRAAVDGYFAECDAVDKLYGPAGLCLYLSEHNHTGEFIPQKRLVAWFMGDGRSDLSPVIEYAFARIQDQIETDPRYREKGGMATRAIFLQKQKMFGGYTDREDVKADVKVDIKFGDGMDKGDFA